MNANRTIILLLALLIPTSLEAQQRTETENIADYISYGTVITQIGLNSVHSWRSDDRIHAIKTELIKDGIAVGSSELIKHFVHKTRPDKSDDKSFWSEHTMLASVNQGWNLSIGINLSLGTGAGRIIAKKHDIIDVGSAFLVGSLVERFIK